MTHEFCDKLAKLGVTLGSDFSLNDIITSVEKSAACRLFFLFKSKLFFKRR